MYSIVLFWYHLPAKAVSRQYTVYSHHFDASYKLLYLLNKQLLIIYQGKNMNTLTIVTFFVAFLSSILSGMSGGGGGFIMTPYYLLIGLTPQQIVGGASVAGIGLGTSSLIAMRSKQLVLKKFLWPLLFITIIFTIFAMLVLPNIQSGIFENAIGILLILLAPTLFIKKASMQPGERSRRSVILGYASYALILFASALGSRLATLLFLPLLFLLGLSAM